MPYHPPATHAWVTIRSYDVLEKAMARCDVNSNELSRLARTSRQNIANIRGGKVERIREDTAGAIERALNLPRGAVFDYPQVTA